MTLTNRKRAFVEHYLAHWNASAAARLAGYSEKTAGSQGGRLLKDVEIQAAIAARLAELQATADEVKLRLTRHARGSMDDFLNGEALSIEQARERGQLDLIKKYKVTRRLEPGEAPRATIETVEIELYDAQAAMVQLGRALSLFVDRQEVTGAGGSPIEVKALDYRTGLTALAPGPIRDSDPSGPDEGSGDGSPVG